MEKALSPPGPDFSPQWRRQEVGISGGEAMGWSVLGWWSRSVAWLWSSL